MSDRFYGKVMISGKITALQLEVVHGMLDELNCDFVEDGSWWSFSECDESDFYDLINYCVLHMIPVMIHWEPRYENNGYMEYYIDGKYRAFDSLADGRVCIAVEELQDHPEKTVEEFIQMLNIPDFPDFEVTDTARKATLLCDNGKTHEVEIQAENEEAVRYYLGSLFSIGSDWEKHKTPARVVGCDAVVDEVVPLAIRFHDCDLTFGLTCKHVASGKTSTVSGLGSVIAESGDSRRVVLTACGHEWNIEEVVIYDNLGQAIRDIGCALEAV